MSSVKLLFDGSLPSLNGGGIAQAGGNLFICRPERAFIDCPLEVLTQTVVEATRKFQRLRILEKSALIETISDLGVSKGAGLWF